MTAAARALVADALGLADVPAAATAFDLPAWDSLGHMRIVLALEARIGRVLSPEELAEIWDVESVAAVLGTSL